MFGASPAGAIVHGEPVSDELFRTRYPWTVAVVSRTGDGLCTGTLISPTVVLTAGHCAHGNVAVLWGDASRTRARRVAVREAIRHPRYQREPMAFDLGLLRLVRPLRVRPAPVAVRVESWHLLRPGAGAVILGWGREGPGMPHADRLARADVRLDGVSARESRIAFISARGGPCGGDSGGPLLMDWAGERLLLVGVASVTATGLCAAGGGLVVYTDVGALHGFLREHVTDLPDRPLPLSFP